MAAALVGLACGEGMRARCRRVSPAGARRGSGAPRPSGVLGCPASGAGRPRRGAGEQRAGGSHRRLHSSLRRSRRALVPVSHARGAETVRTPEHFPGRARGPRGRARRTRICARMSRSACRRSGSPQLCRSRPAPRAAPAPVAAWHSPTSRPALSPPHDLAAPRRYRSRRRRPGGARSPAGPARPDQVRCESALCSAKALRTSDEAMRRASAAHGSEQSLAGRAAPGHGSQLSGRRWLWRQQPHQPGRRRRLRRLRRRARAGKSRDMAKRGGWCRGSS